MTRLDEPVERYLVVPSRVTVGWGFGTPAYEAFLSAQIEDVAENY